MASFLATDTLILMALPQESQGLFEKSPFTVAFTGVGKIKSTFAASKLIEKHRPKHVLNFGTAGSKTIPPGKLVECVRFVQRDPVFATFQQKIFQVSAITDLPQVTCGTADFVEFEKPKIECDVFDMEAYALAFVCDQLAVGFNSVKYVTDASDENTVDDWKKNLAPASEALFRVFTELIMMKSNFK